MRHKMKNSPLCIDTYWYVLYVKDMFTINLSSPVPLYTQIIENIEGYLESGELEPGDSLPAIRTLAKQLDVAVNTVARAYQELERGGLIVSGGRRGTFIRNDIELRSTSGDDTKKLKEAIRTLIEMGKSRGEIEATIARTLRAFYE
jgi:GntR family transcriptional regulator